MWHAPEEYVSSNLPIERLLCDDMNVVGDMIADFVVLIYWLQTAGLGEKANSCMVLY